MRRSPYRIVDPSTLTDNQHGTSGSCVQKATGCFTGAGAVVCHTDAQCVGALSVGDLFVDKPPNVHMESGPIAGGLAQEVLEKPSHRTVFILREGPWRRTEELITAISCHGREHGGSDVPPQTVPQRTV